MKIHRPTKTLTELRDFLRRHRKDGVRCPVCDQWAQEYHRTINSGMARAIIEMYRVAGAGSWFYKPDVLRGFGAAARDEALLRWWGLIEEESAVRPDGGRAGWWRITPKGEMFVLGEITVPKYAVLYANKLLRYEGERIDIHDALGQHFSLEDLLHHI